MVEEAQGALQRFNVGREVETADIVGHKLLRNIPVSKNPRLFQGRVPVKFGHHSTEK